jgi:predicted O-methyltransferase YrrM
MPPVVRLRDRARCAADACIASCLPGGWRLARRLALVDGYLYPHEAVFLYHLARASPGDGAIVEVGSFLGRSTLCLAAGAARRGTEVHAVDPHVYDSEPQLRANLRRFRATRRVVVRVERSTDAAAAWSGPVRIAFIDGAHDEQSVTEDVHAWLPHVVPGGYLALHDSTALSGFPGPRAAAERLVRRGEVFDAAGRIGSITYGRVGGGTDGWTPPAHGRRALDGLIRAVKSRR